MALKRLCVCERGREEERRGRKQEHKCVYERKDGTRGRKSVHIYVAAVSVREKKG